MATLILLRIHEILLRPSQNATGMSLRARFHRFEAEDSMRRRIALALSNVQCLLADKRLSNESLEIVDCPLLAPPGCDLRFNQ
jgi:hypothetical protein